MASSLSCDEKDIRKRRVQLSGLPSHCDEEYIKLYFEDDEHLGESIELKHVHLDTTQNSAVIEPKDPNAVGLIIDKQPFKIEEASVTAEIFSPLTVEVVGPTTIICDKYETKLKMFLKNEKRSGGGTIEELTVTKPGTAMVKYTSEEVAERVARRQKLEFMGSELEVRLYHPTINKSNTVLMSGLPEHVDKEYLELYFEEDNKFGDSIPVEIELDEISHSALLKFNDVDDVLSFLEHEPLEIDGHEVTIKWFSSQAEVELPSPELPASCTVKVEGPSDIICPKYESLLMRFFKNENRSGGGTIQSFEFIEEGIAHIIFDNDKVASRVVSKGKHTVQNQQLSVQLIETTPAKTQKESKDSSPRGSTVSLASYTVELVGLPLNVTEKLLMVFIENEVGVEVSNVTLLAETSSALLELETAEDADKIVKMKEFTMKGKTVIAKPCATAYEDTCAVEVTCKDLTQDHYDFLKMYFNNKKRSGGGNLVESSANTEANIAYFKFRSSQVAERVCKKDHREEGITVKLYKGELPHSNSKTSPDEPFTQIEKESVTSCVKVGDVPESVTNLILELYFENETRSGGGTIESIADDFEDGCVKYVKFESPEVAEKVSKREHIIDGHKLQVKLYVQAPYDNTKVLVKCLPEDYSKENLCFFLEAKSNTKPKYISYHIDREDVALVTMETELDFKALKKACAENDFLGVQLEVSRVPFSNIVWVGYLRKQTKPLNVELYFESKKGGEGCQVEKVVMNTTEGTCLVYFENYKDVDIVLNRKHKIDNQEVLVKRYESCVRAPENDSQERKLKIPEPIEVEADIHKIEFLQNTDNRRIIEEDLLKSHTRVIWPADKKGAVKLECTLTKNDKGAFQLVRKWETRTRETFDQCLKLLCVYEMQVLQEIWEKAMPAVRNLKITNPNEVSVLTLNDVCIFRIVGETGAADLLRQQIKSIIDEVMADLAKVKEVLKNLTYLELQLLQKIQFEAYLRSAYPDLSVLIEDNQLILEGCSCSVRDAKVSILEKTKDFASSRIEHISRTSIELYKSTVTKQFVEEKCERSQIMSVWIIDEDHVDVCCSDRKLVHQCIRIIKESVKENVIDIQDIEIQDNNKQQFKNKIEEIDRTEPGKVLITISPDNTKVIVCATNDIVDKVVKQITNFIHCNSIVTENVDCEYDVLMLLQKHHLKDIEGNEDKTIKIFFDENFECIKIRCLQPMMTNAIRRVEEIISKVQCQEHTISRPGIEEFMKQEKGKKHLDAIEMAYPCRLVREGQEESSHNSMLIARYKYQNRHIDALVCDITEQDVGMIINPDDEKLQLLGSIGRAIVLKGGDSIKQACLQRGKLVDNEVFMTDGGRLKCLNIAHVKSKEWKGGKNKEQKYLEDTVMNCLLMADTLKIKSVAIPSIGCGVNGFPVDEATTCIVNAVQRFFMKKQNNAIEWIYLCDTDIMKVRSFSSALSKIFGSNHMQVVTDDEQFSSAGYSLKVHHVGTKRTASKKPKTPKTLPQKSKIQMKIVKGELAKQIIEVIVNTTSRDLALTNGIVSQSILKVAGNSLQDEVRSKYPDGLRGFKVAVSAGHMLQCKTILHTSISPYDQKNIGQGKQNLREIVKLCLEETDKLKHSSVAFPAIGTGNLGYPHDIVAEVMWSAVEEYGNQNPKTTVREVSFVLYPLDSKSISAFEKAYSQFKSKQSQKPVMLAPMSTTSSQSSSAILSNQLPGVFMFDTIRVSAKTGDLLQENIDCIVNGTDKNFNRGKMMKRILLECGKTLEEELDDLKDEMQKNKIACSSASPLPCKRIIHVIVSSKQLCERIKKALELADRLRITSVGIPAMDVGVEKGLSNARNLAKQMVQAVRLFAKSHQGSNIQEVRFVLFNHEYLGVFQSAVEDASESKQSILGFMSHKGAKKSTKQTSVETETLTNPVTFIIYSLSRSVIENVKKKIDACLDEEMKTMDIDDDMIEFLDDHQVLDLETKMRHCHVHADIDRSNNSISITGIKDNVHEASLKVQTFLRNVSEMDWMEKLVQWYSILVNDDEEEISEYDKGVNALLEKAYTRKLPTASYVNRIDKKTYVIDFDKMEEKPENDPTCAPARVLRRDRIKGGFGCEMPLTWDDMNGKTRVVKLCTQSAEFGDISSKFTQSAGKYNCTVEQIERIQNRTLWEQYQSKKKEMEEVNVGQINERQLWHGTSEAAVDSINMYGFNRSYCGKNATKFGDGVYFAVNAEYSCMKTYSAPDQNDVRRMYYCRVLTGDYALGEEGMRVPPANPKRGRHCIFNSVVNNLQMPDMFVIFHDSQAYPEYLIYFKR